MKVLVYPQDSNPYQALLYRNLTQRHEVVVSYLRRYGFLNVILLPLMLLIRRMQGFKVLHLHWPAFLVTLPVPGRRYLSYRFLRGCVRWSALLGFDLVWTIHNVVPHQKETSNDEEAARFLSKHADAKIVHSRIALEQMRDLGMSVVNTRIIPHGNYDGVYGNDVTQAQGREMLGIPQNAFVFLFFGLIRPYKGVADLIRSFGSLPGGDLRLVVVGQSFDPEVDALAAANGDDRIMFHLSRIPDSNVAGYFAAADLVCLPFRSVTTSGSALLALTFGCPIVAKRIGDLEDLPDDVGYFYDDDDSGHALADAMSAGCSRRDALEGLRRGAIAASNARSWSGIADQTYQVYAETHVG